MRWPGLLAWFIFSLLTPAFAADPTPTPASATTPTIPWNASTQGGFVVSLGHDLSGNLWAGTEDKGVWRYSLATHKWTQFAGSHDLGDAHCYALACDRLGRLWCGTATHGVSVFNGREWRHLGPTNGPLGSRVFALTTSPVDGDVWGATEAGLFRYSLSKDTWSYYTKADGLPSDGANALAFGEDGTLYVGTQCDGVAIASAQDDYKTWRVVPGPAKVPMETIGDGLPSALTNCLLVAQDGTVFCGTGHGIAASHDNGKTWHYRREGEQQALLREDYVTALAEDGAEHLWVGHRQGLPEVFDPRTGLHIPLPQPLQIADNYVCALLPTGTAMLMGGYGGGLMQAETGAKPAAQTQAAAPPVPASFPELPSYAKPPTLAELNTLLAQVGQVKPQPDADKPFVAALDDDWLTKGDWQGRYGRYWACLSAMCSPYDYVWGAGWEPISYSCRIGLHCDPGDSVRYWVHWLYTANPNSLEMSPTYLDSCIRKGLTIRKINRREAEIDDHGEVYPQSQDGPHLYFTLSVPAGIFYLSMYDFNKDGHTGANCWRDYRLSVRTHNGIGLQDISSFVGQPEIAHGRIKDFWGGVWKRFLVRGPIDLTIEVNRNNSFNTILPGVMLDLVDERPAPYFQTVSQWLGREIQQEKECQSLAMETPEAHAKRFRPALTEAEAAGRLFTVLQQTQLTNPAWWATSGRQYYMQMLRWYKTQFDQAYPHITALLSSRLGTCYYQTGFYSQWEECQTQLGLTTARQVEEALRCVRDSDAYSGAAYPVVTTYLTAHAVNKPSQTKTKGEHK